MEGDRTLSGRPDRPEPRRIPTAAGEAGDDRAGAHALVESIRREELNALDRAQALRRLRTALDLSSWQQVAELVGITRQHVHNILNVTRLPEPIRDDIRAGDLSEKHARALLRLRDRPEDQRRLWEEIHTRPLSGRAAEGRARQMARGTSPAPRASPVAPPPSPPSHRGLEALAGDIIAALVTASPDEVRAAAPVLRDLRRRIAHILDRAGG